MTDTNPARRTEPADRLGRIAAAMLDAAENHPEHQPGDHAVIMLNDGHDAMTSFGGYHDDLDALTDMFVHFRAVARANGKDATFIGIPDDASGLG